MTQHLGRVITHLTQHLGRVITRMTQHLGQVITPMTQHLGRVITRMSLGTHCVSHAVRPNHNIIQIISKSEQMENM